MSLTYRFKSIRFLQLLVTMLLLPACASHAVPKPPVVLPFAAERLGSKVDTEVRIVKELLYSVDLLFMYKAEDKAEYRRVRKLVDPGLSIPLRVKIVLLGRYGEETILDGEMSKVRLYAWRPGRMKNQIASIILKPGRYRVSVETLTDNPALAGTQINFAIGRAYTGK